MSEENLEFFHPSIFLADFNHDGIAEIVAGNSIYNARTGVKLCDGGKNGMGLGRIWAGLASFSLAANMDEDEALELVAGYTVYKVDINNPEGMEGNSMRPINMLIKGKGYEGSVAVADINEDGRLDVIVTLEDSKYYFDETEGIVKYLGIYCYTIAGDTAQLLARTDMVEEKYVGEFSPSMTIGKLTPSSNPSIICLNYIGRTNIRYKLRSFVYDGTEILKEEWALPVDENTALTGLTMFDLNNDGMMDVIYRDQSKLMIINIIDGKPVIVYQAPCYSGTAGEKPVVGDIDGRGEARICTTCANTVNDRNGRLTIFGPPEGERWAPARKNWHQYTYIH